MPNGMLFDVTPEPVADSGVKVGDCVELMRELPKGSVPLIFADPPFNVGYGYDVYDDCKSVDDYLDWCRIWGAEAVRVLATTGTLWLAIGDEFAAELKVLFHRDLGLSLRSWVVWHYTFGVNCTKKFTRSHVHLFYFTKTPDRYTFERDDLLVPSARQLIGDKRASAGGRLPDDTWILRPKDAVDGGAFDPGSDTWSVPRVNGTFKERVGWHPCQMPEAVLARIVSACSKPGDLVLDPFCGSGTTSAVAKKLGRAYLTFDISRAYAAGAADRLAAVNVGDPVAGGGIYTPKAAPEDDTDIQSGQKKFF